MRRAAAGASIESVLSSGESVCRERQFQRASHVWGSGDCSFVNVSVLYYRTQCYCLIEGIAESLRAEFVHQQSLVGGSSFEENDITLCLSRNKE